MNAFDFDRPSNHRGLANSGCAQSLREAEVELSSFFQAVGGMFGLEAATFSAEDWLRELVASDRLPSSVPEWRRITAKSWERLAHRIASPSLISAIDGSLNVRDHQLSL
jgi:hypothetical protein